MARIIQTVTIIQDGNRILLGMKKRGFGEGKWNGFGGKVKNSESIKDTAGRELLEEAHVEVDKIQELGVIDFEFQGEPDIMEVHFLKATEFEREPAESEEMKPQWFDVDKIPYDQMWSDDKYWMPLFLENKKFRGEFLFGDYNKIVDYKLRVVERL